MMIRRPTCSPVSNPGNPMHDILAPKVQKDGSVRLMKVGVENTDDFIQRFEECTDLSMIVNKIAQGELELPQARPDQFVDMTKVPSDLAGMLQLQLDSRRLFYSLPVDVREEFHNNPDEFLLQSGEDEWFSKISPVLSDEIKEQIWPVPLAASPEKPVEKSVEKVVEK